VSTPSDLPDPQWFIAHNRMGPTVHFGPFATAEEALVYARNECGGGLVVPLHPPVPADQIDWEGSRMREAVARIASS
jgi:hypothetical protein